MALRFLADHCIANSVVQTLREAGNEVHRVRDVLPVESADTVVIAKAQEIGAILLSLNGDFADIVAYPPRNYKGIVTLQMRNHAEILPHLMARLMGYLGIYPILEHYRGKLLVVEVDRVRVRQ
ncbi:MAG: DUF5615 family PIN-like protein [Candidatus Acidiferrum sp.]